LLKSPAAARELLQNVRPRSPDEGLWIAVSLLDEGLDGLDRIRHAGEAAAAHGVAGN